MLNDNLSVYRIKLIFYKEGGDPLKFDKTRKFFRYLFWSILTTFNFMIT